MAEHYVGLDIGSFAVRAAELSNEGGVVTLHRFAQLTLPARSVVDGEIMDPAAVTATLRELWRRGEFKSKKVVVGVANRWVKVRQTEVPDLPASDIRNALRFEAQEVIPFAGDDAVVDYVVQERVPSPEGGEMLRILSVTAQRQMVSRLLDTVKAAGLAVAMVDLTPFALLRALVPSPQGRSEALVSVGAGLTNVLVHTDGIPRLVRMTPRAGASVRDSLSRSLGVEHDRAEALKRGAAVALADPQTAQAAEIIASELAPLVQEIQGSLDFFLTQPENDDVELNRVILTGAGAKMIGLRARLATELRVPVDMASPLEYLRLGKTGLTDDQLTAAAAVMAAPVGLALAPLAPPSTRLTSLFPEDFAQATAVRKQRLLVAGAVGGLAVVLGGLWSLQAGKVAAAQSEAQRAEQQATQLQAEVAKLTPFEKQQQENDARRALIKSALTGDVDPTAIIDRITAALPGDVWVTSITSAASSTGDGSLGTVTVAARGRDQTAAAHFLTAMRQVPQFAEVWVPSETKGQGSGSASASTFTANIKLAPAAASARMTKYEVQK